MSIRAPGPAPATSLRQNVYLINNSCLPNEHSSAGSCSSTISASECPFDKQIVCQKSILTQSLSNKLMFEIVVGARFKMVREASFHTQTLHSHFGGLLCCARHGGTNGVHAKTHWIKVQIVRGSSKTCVVLLINWFEYLIVTQTRVWR